MKETGLKSLTVKCSGLQGLYWMSFCSVYSFASVFLLSQNFKNHQIGILLAVSNIAAVFLQPAIGSLADRTTKISLKGIISYIALINIVLLAGLVLLPPGAAAGAVLYGGAVALTLTLQPLLNSLIFEYINEGSDVNYGVTRGMGSISFAFVSFILGLLINSYNPHFLPFVCIGLFAGLLLMLRILPMTEAQKKRGDPGANPDRGTVPGGFFDFGKKYHRFFPFLLALAFLFVFHTMANAYLVQIMKHVGGKDGDVGLSLTIAAVCELPAMLGFGYLVSRYKSGMLLKFAGCFYVVRSLLFLLSTSVFMVNLAQVFQGLSFAVYAPASIYYVNQMMSKEDKVKGQTFMVGASTLGSVFGSLLGGWLLDNASVEIMLAVGAAAAAAGCLLLFYSVKRDC